MTEYVLFPDVEAALITYLHDTLTVPVVGRVPNPRPTQFIRLERTGGSTPHLVIEEVDVNVEAWAARDQDAVSLAQRARAAIGRIGRVGGVTFYRPRAYSTPARLPDPTTNQARYTALYALRVRGLGTTSL